MNASGILAGFRDESSTNRDDELRDLGCRAVRTITETNGGALECSLGAPVR
jgi:hypothetical protein